LSEDDRRGLSIDQVKFQAFTSGKIGFISATSLSHRKGKLYPTDEAGDKTIEVVVAVVLVVIVKITIHLIKGI
jgi:hypothetical protein